MQKHIVKVRSVDKVTHNVLKIVTAKPPQFNFVPGQATEVSINKIGWRDVKRPFTFTCLPEDDHLEFIIKTYPSRKGVTNQLLGLKKGKELILHDVFGAITYKGEGVFIAGGAGVTSFISILRDLKSKNLIGNNKLIFANKKKEDIIHEEEFKKILGTNFINILSDETVYGYVHGHITKEFIEANSGGTCQCFYVCGPTPMMEVVEKGLQELQVNERSVIKEKFNEPVMSNSEK